MFKDRTKKFDNGMLLNTLIVGKGINILMDSDLADHSKLVLQQTFQRTPRKGTK